MVCAEIECGYGKITVPYGMLNYSVLHGDFNSIQVMIAAKMLGNSFSLSDMEKLSSLTNLHPKTILKHVHVLVDKKWIGFSFEQQRYFNRGWTYLTKQVPNFSGTGYTITRNSIIKFKAFAIGATYDQLIASQQHNRWLAIRERRQKGISQQSGLVLKGFYPVANVAYSKIFCLSESTASRYRKLAATEGFIEVKEVIDHIDIDGNGKQHQFLNSKYGQGGLIYRDRKYGFQNITHVRSKMIRKRVRYKGQEKSATI